MKKEFVWQLQSFKSVTTPYCEPQEVCAAVCKITSQKHHRLKTVVIFLQEMAYFDDPLHSTGALTTALSTHASAVQGVSMTMVKTCGGIVHH